MPSPTFKPFPTSSHLSSDSFPLMFSRHSFTFSSFSSFSLSHIFPLYHQQLIVFAYLKKFFTKRFCFCIIIDEKLKYFPRTPEKIKFKYLMFNTKRYSNRWFLCQKIGMKNGMKTIGKTKMNFD